MGISSFLKKIFNEPEKIEPTKDKIAFSDIENFIKKKSNETNAKENESISFIKDKIVFFTSELKEKIKLVNEVNIESKEKNDKIKSAVYEGRKKYIEFLERLIDNLETVVEKNEISLEKVTENINSTFLNFNEISDKSYRRATILIGKEMRAIRETLKKLSNELIIIFKESKETISISKGLSLIELKINEINEIKEKFTKIDKEIINLINIILEKEKESKEISEKIDKIRKSQEHIENIEKENIIPLEEKEVEKEIYNLKQFIDFKVLSNFFHIFENKMEIVKLYRDDFLLEFKKDKGNRLLNLLNESKLNNEKICNKIKQIQDKEQEIEKSKSEIKKDETQAFLSELEKVNEEAKDLRNEKEWAEKKNEKLKAIQDETLKIIKDELNFMNIELEKD